MVEKHEEEETLFNYQIIEKLSQGAFGIIFRIYDKSTKKEYAMKMEKVPGSKQIAREYTAYRYIYSKEIEMFPKIYCSGECFYDGCYRPIIVMELLGSSLEHLFIKCNRIFSLKTVLMLGELMLSRIEYLHNKSFIHRDIKPDNFMFGKKGEKENNFYMIDLGLARKYRSPRTYVHIEAKNGKSLVGTARFASLNTHRGNEQSRRDDLESMWYCLIYFSKGRLPWQGMKGSTKAKKYDNIKFSKENTSIPELCSELPPIFCEVLQYIRSLSFTKTPDYQYIRKKIRDTMKMYRINCNYVFDWHQRDPMSSSYIRKC